MQWLQNQNQSNVDNLNDVRRENIWHIMNKKKGYLQIIIYEVWTHNKIKNIRDLYRGIKDFKNCHQTSTNIVSDEKVLLVTYCHKILNR